MSTPQPGVLADVPRLARFIELDLAHGADPRAVLDHLAAWPIGDDLLVGLGRSFVLALGADLPGLTVHPRHVGPALDVPSTPAAIWLRITGSDRGAILHRSRSLLRGLGPAVTVQRLVDAFMYGDGDDLSGYEDGTENPTGDDAMAAAIASDGSTFVATQQWVHDLDTFEAMPQTQRDHTIGRRQSDNEELEDAPDSAHVKRTAQEDFQPVAFIVRRSMPWTDGDRQGLYFLAFGRRFDAYEALLSRMVGQDDGVVDALFTFTRPISGAFFWCPPVRDGRLALGALA